jgi:hypothetical protein
MNFDEENALIQRHVKESKDKSAELIKKFDLTVEKIRINADASNLSKIVGRGLMGAMLSDTQKNPLMSKMASGLKG